MSALAAALAAFDQQQQAAIKAATPATVPAPVADASSNATAYIDCPSDDLPSSQPPSLSASTCPSESPSSTPAVPLRKNEHLAVLLPEHLWKPDSHSSVCDNFYCRARFSFFERRHHCRKCGGVFCANCTSTSTPLLDVRNLPFLQPPRGRPLTDYESPNSRVIDARVCDECYAHVHGKPNPRHLQAEASARLLASRRTSEPSPLSPILEPGSPSTPSRSPRSPSALSTPRSARLSLRHRPSHDSLRKAALAVVEADTSDYGGFDTYPLRRASAICKSAGLYRWEPKADPIHPDARLPSLGGRKQWEVELEREEAQERLLKSNPPVLDGAIRYRFLCSPPPPHVLQSAPFIIPPTAS